MVKTFGAAIAVSAALALSGCSGGEPASPPGEAPSAAAAGDTKTVCTEWMAAEQPFLLNTAPEAKAYNKVMADSYQGRQTARAGEVQRAYWSAWADAIRPLVGRAGTPELQAALTAHVEDLDRRAAGGAAPAPPLSTAIGELCLR